MELLELRNDISGKKNSRDGINIRQSGRKGYEPDDKLPETIQNESYTEKSLQENEHSLNEPWDDGTKSSNMCITGIPRAWYPRK